MNGRINLRHSVMVASAVIAMMLMGASVASAINWSPPCAQTTIINNTGCTIGLCPMWVPMLAPPCTPFIPPGGIIGINTPGPLQLNGMFSWGGTAYPLQPAPPNGCGAPLWVPNYMTGPAPGCCVDVFVNPATCTICVYPSAGGGPCRL